MLWLKCWLWLICTDVRMEKSPGKAGWISPRLSAYCWGRCILIRPVLTVPIPYSSHLHPSPKDEACHGVISSYGLDWNPHSWDRSWDESVKSSHYFWETPGNRLNVPVGSRRMSGVIYFTLIPLACKGSLLYFLTTKSLAPRTCDSRWLTCEVECEGSGGRMKRARHEGGWGRTLSRPGRHF